MEHDSGLWYLWNLKCFVVNDISSVGNKMFWLRTKFLGVWTIPLFWKSKVFLRKVLSKLHRLKNPCLFKGFYYIFGGRLTRFSITTCWFFNSSFFSDDEQINKKFIIGEIKTGKVQVRLTFRIFKKDM